jgi:ArpU family phage transcriptional regulator
MIDTQVQNKKWRGVYKDISRAYIRDLFNKYKSCVLIVKEGVNQKVTHEFDKISVQGGQPKGFEDEVIKVADAEIYVKEIDKILQKLPGMYKKIMIEAFIRDIPNIQIYISLGLPERTYYYMKDEAVKMFVDEYITNRLMGKQL